MMPQFDFDTFKRAQESLLWHIAVFRDEHYGREPIILMTDSLFSLLTAAHGNVVISRKEKTLYGCVVEIVYSHDERPYCFWLSDEMTHVRESE